MRIRPARLKPRPTITLPVVLLTLMAAAPLQTEERAIIRAVDVHNAEALALLERVVNINSGTQNLRGRARGRQGLSRASSTRWDSRPSGWTARRGIARGIWSPSIRAPGPKMLLIGHLDTVFERDSPFQKFRTHRRPTRDAGRASST